MIYSIINTILLIITIILWIKKNNTAKLLASNLRFVEADIKDKEELIKEFKLNKLFSEVALNFYFDILNHSELYYIDEYCLGKEIGRQGISLWLSNGVWQRNFYTQNELLYEEVKEMNKKLTRYDHLLLDEIAKEFKKHQSLDMIKIKRFLYETRETRD